MFVTYTHDHHGDHVNPWCSWNYTYTAYPVMCYDKPALSVCLISILYFINSQVETVTVYWGTWYVNNTHTLCFLGLYYYICIYSACMYVSRCIQYCVVRVFISCLISSNIHALSLWSTVGDVHVSSSYDHNICISWSLLYIVYHGPSYT